MCDSCQAMMINDVACHETGCPNSWKHPATDEPYPKQCRECGCDFVPEDRDQDFCESACYCDYNGLPAPDDAWHTEMTFMDAEGQEGW